MSVDAGTAGSQQNTTSPTITIADSSGHCSAFSESPNLAMQAERIKFQITLEEPEEEEENNDFHASAATQKQQPSFHQSNEQMRYSNPSTNYSSSTTSTTVISPTTTHSMMITAVGSNSQAASNFVVTTTASPSQDYHNDKFNRQTSSSIHSKSLCDEKSVSIHDEQNTKR